MNKLSSPERRSATPTLDVVRLLRTYKCELHVDFIAQTTGHQVSKVMEVCDNLKQRGVVRMDGKSAWLYPKHR